MDAKRVAALRQSGKVVHPEDLGIRRSDATRSLLAAGSVADRWSGPTDCTTHRQNSGAGENLPLHAESRVSWLAHTASACLIDEARLSPKPGLVDSRGNGAHQDLNLALMERSARSLQPTFHALAEQSWRRPADIALREPSPPCREGEAQMMRVGLTPPRRFHLG